MINNAVIGSSTKLNGIKYHTLSNSKIKFEESSLKFNFIILKNAYLPEYGTFAWFFYFVVFFVLWQDFG